MKAIKEIQKLVDQRDYYRYLDNHGMARIKQQEIDKVKTFVSNIPDFPFSEGDDYYTIEHGGSIDHFIIVWSCWDDQSEEDYDPNENYFKSVREAMSYIERDHKDPTVNCEDREGGKMSFNAFFKTHRFLTPSSYNQEFGHYWDPSDFGKDTMKELDENVIIHTYENGLHIIQYNRGELQYDHNEFELPLHNGIYEGSIRKLEQKLYNHYLTD